MSWTKKVLDEEREKNNRRTLTISINSTDEGWVNSLKKLFDTDKDGEAIKNGAILGLSVTPAYIRDNFRLVPYIKRERKKKKSKYLKGIKVRQKNTEL